MAQTTTSQAACRAEVWLDKAGGTPTNISGSTTTIDPRFTLAQGEYHPHASDWPSRLDGGKDGGVRLNVLYSSSADEGWDVLKDWWSATSPGARTLTWYAPANEVGADKFSGEFRLEGLRWTHGAGDPAPLVVTADLVPDGEVTQSTVSS